MDLRKITTRLIYNIWRRLLVRYGSLENKPVVLDCGSGPGSLLGLMEEWFPQTTLYGLDIDYTVVSKARQTSRRTNYLVASAETLPFPEKAVDILVTLHMVEHLSEPENFFREANRVLRPEGILALATPNPQSIGARIMKDRWSGYCPEHIALHPPETWERMLTGHGFSVLRHGTTGLSSLPLCRKSPLGLINWGALFLFGFFPWRQGEAYICVARKNRDRGKEIDDIKKRLPHSRD